MILQNVDDWLDETFGRSDTNKTIILEDRNKISPCCGADMYKTKTYLSNGGLLVCVTCNKEY